jgi:hypothetical protein
MPSNRFPTPVLGLAVASAIMAALPLSADPALDALLPLMEVYGPDGHNPPYDVAGIRCAALWTAQIAWGQSHGERVRVDRQMEEDLDTFLDRSMSGRVEAGMDLTRAYTTVYEDTEQVIARYTAL